MYGVYHDEACISPLADYDPNPFEMETDDECSAFNRGFGPEESLEILSCSSTCICYEHHISTGGCNSTTSTVKEACMGKCRLEDTKNSFVRIKGFMEGCGDKQVPDDQYSCACTGLHDNCLCKGMDEKDECDKSDGASTFTRTAIAFFALYGLLVVVALT